MTLLNPACAGCGAPIVRRKSGGHDKLKFCSRRCAAIVTNKTQPKRKGHGTPTCALCGLPKSYTGTICRACVRARFNERSLGELRAEYSTAAFHAKVRGLARYAYKGPRRCAACGYSLHVDICHIRDVADWPATATLSEVNNPANLVALDKRCHWEFDHGYLIYSEGHFSSAGRV